MYWLCYNYIDNIFRIVYFRVFVGVVREVEVSIKNLRCIILGYVILIIDNVN